MPTRDRADYMREYRARRKVYGEGPPTVSYVDVPVLDGVASLPDGSTVRSDSQIVRVAIPHNLPKPEPFVEPEERIAELEAENERLRTEVVRLKRALTQANRDAVLRKVNKH